MNKKMHLLRFILDC